MDFGWLLPGRLQVHGHRYQIYNLEVVRGGQKGEAGMSTSQMPYILRAWVDINKNID
jgi:hypothetical protein